VGVDKINGSLGKASSQLKYSHGIIQFPKAPTQYKQFNFDTRLLERFDLRPNK